MKMRTSFSLIKLAEVMGHPDCQLTSMFQESLSVSQSTTPYRHFPNDLPGAVSDASIPRGYQDLAEDHGGFASGLARRWRRERRRRKVGRAYDMALEIAMALPGISRAPSVLDAGCGNGYIAHHLSGILGAVVTGIDLDQSTEARIDYRPFDGTRFPIESASMDAVLFCYVLHHAQDPGSLLGEVRRVLRSSGRVVIYEDIPDSWWDRLVCGVHNRQWRGRTGPCSFQTEEGWRNTFNAAGFQITNTRSLSRWRNLAHPVSRRIFVLQLEKEKLSADYTDYADYKKGIGQETGAVEPDVSQASASVSGC